MKKPLDLNFMFQVALLIGVGGILGSAIAEGLLLLIR